LEFVILTAIGHIWLLPVGSRDRCGTERVTCALRQVQ